LDDLKRTVQIRTLTRRGVERDPAYATPLPREISLQLTYKCNLRCVHCFQWSEDGFFQDFSHATAQTEISPDLVAGLLAFTDPVKAKVFLWGGEPLMHSRFGELAELLAAHERTVNMCTNGLLLERNAEHLLRIGDKLNLLVSLDGLGADHDALRGRGTFERTVRNLEFMLDLQRSGRFGGEISLSCMVSDATAPHMYAFMEWAEERGVNTVYFQFPWYISPDAAQAMDTLYAEHFGWLHPPEPGAKGTWHSYNYRLSAENTTLVQSSMRALADRVWNSRIRYQPQVGVEEAPAFLLGDPAPAQGRRQCLAISNRMEVHADGKVSSCKFFPEFVIGDLHDATPETVWQSEDFRRVRESLHSTNLMPVCSKCILLYLNGV
jgi:radical SAM protein with 4Fe4S-binding SPASM domain